MFCPVNTWAISILHTNKLSPQTQSVFPDIVRTLPLCTHRHTQKTGTETENQRFSSVDRIYSSVVMGEKMHIDISRSPEIFKCGSKRIVSLKTTVSSWSLYQSTHTHTHSATLALCGSLFLFLSLSPAQPNTHFLFFLPSSALRKRLLSPLISGLARVRSL